MDAFETGLLQVELCPFGEDEATGAGCIRAAGHEGLHYIVPGCPEDAE